VPTGSGTGTIKATIIQGLDSVRSGTESEISVEVTVAYNGDGSTATLTMPAAGTGAVSYTTAAGTSASYTVTNLDADAFSITAASAATGDAAVLSVKMGSLYDVFVNSQLGAPDMLREGDYSIALETTLPLQNYADATVTKFTGLVHLYDGAGKSLVVGTDGADTITGTAGAEVIVTGAGKDTISTGGGADYIVLGAGQGSTTLANANTVAGHLTEPSSGTSGFTNGVDKFALSGDLTFADLTVAGANSNADTNVSITATGEYLMTITGLAPGYILTDDFVTDIV
jgi:Ca2+-binding RTX toxin-like protein